MASQWDMPSRGETIPCLHKQRARASSWGAPSENFGANGEDDLERRLRAMISSVSRMVDQSNSSRPRSFPTAGTNPDRRGSCPLLEPYVGAQQGDPVRDDSQIHNFRRALSQPNSYGGHGVATPAAPRPHSGVGLPENRTSIPPRPSEKARRPLLPPKAPQHTGRHTLILDMDETLIHTKFEADSSADFVLPVQLGEGRARNAWILVRDEAPSFLTRMAELYEVVIWTSSASQYAGPLLDLLDNEDAIHARLFRESCDGPTFKIKDLSRLGRHLSSVIIVDNSPESYCLHPENAVPIRSFFGDPQDHDLVWLGDRLCALAATPSVLDPLCSLRAEMEKRKAA